MSSSDTFIGSVDAEFARTGDVTVLMRAAYVSSLNYGTDAAVHIARLAVSDLVAARDGLFVMSLLDMGRLSRDGHMFEFTSAVKERVAADPAISEIADAVQADLASGKMSGGQWVNVFDRDRPLYALMLALRPLALEELRSRQAAGDRTVAVDAVSRKVTRGPGR